MSPSEPKPLRTLDMTPRLNEAIKPAELIQVTGHHDLTLNARRAITILWHHAHAQKIEPGKDYHIEIDHLRPYGHKGYEMVEEAIESLMRTLLVVRNPDGSTLRVQFLGATNLDSPHRAAGMLTYSFDKQLINLMNASTVWGKIALPVLMAFTTKYAISLYENIAQFHKLSYKTFQTYTLDQLRELLGVPPGKYKTFGELNLHVLKPAVAEVNALAPFGITVLPIKQGKRVTKVQIGWWNKDEQGLDDAAQELGRTKLGRRARVAGLAEHVAAPTASIHRLVRREKTARSKRPIA